MTEPPPIHHSTFKLVITDLIQDYKQDEPADNIDLKIECDAPRLPILDEIIVLICQGVPYGFRVTQVVLPVTANGDYCIVMQAPGLLRREWLVDALNASFTGGNINRMKGLVK